MKMDMLFFQKITVSCLFGSKEKMAKQESTNSKMVSTGGIDCL